MEFWRWNTNLGHGCIALKKESFTWEESTGPQCFKVGREVTPGRPRPARAVGTGSFGLGANLGYTEVSRQTPSFGHGCLDMKDIFSKWKEDPACRSVGSDGKVLRPSESVSREAAWQSHHAHAPHWIVPSTPTIKDTGRVSVWGSTEEVYSSHVKGSRDEDKGIREGSRVIYVAGKTSQANDLKVQGWYIGGTRIREPIGKI